ncbi:MAG: ABC transporter permease [Candidatus Didemnitutus sp.]|nr:ABC transporter permease [Candidatus Didemnitutus sp.]
MLQDLRFALRLLARSPGFTVATILVLAVGIGLNSGMFTFVYSLAFTPRPFAEPDRIVQVFSLNRKQRDDSQLFSHQVWSELAERRELFSAVAAFKHTLVGHQAGGETRRAFASLVSANYFSTLGVPLVRGRAFTAEESRPGAGIPSVIVSHAHWRKTGFAADMVGRTLRINEQLFTVVGITPESFSGTTALFGPEFYFPLGMFDALENVRIGEERRALGRNDSFNLFVFARLAPGVELATATAALDALGTNLERTFPVDFKDHTITAGPLPRLGTSSSPRSEGPVKLFALVLLGLAGAVLLIVCLNLAGLLLARGQSRRKEFAIRLALGGSRARLVRQLCIEGFLVAAIGGALGMIAAHVALDLLVGAFEARLPLTLFPTTAGSGVVVAATTALCVGATLVFSLGPALRLSRGDVLTDLKLQSGTEAAAPRGAWWRPRHPLLVAQVALSLALLIVAGLFLRTALGVSRTDHGFHADNTVVAEVDASLGKLDETRSLEYFRAASQKLAALPGVQSVSIAAIVPYGFNSVGRSVRRDGPPPAKGSRPATAAEGRAYSASWNAVGADYFTTLGLALRDGRAFTESESLNSGAPRVAIIDEGLARALWPEGGAVGRFIRDTDGGDSNAAALQVVGVVSSTRMDFFEEDTPRAIYVPFAQGFYANAHFHVRPAVDAEPVATRLVGQVRETLADAMPGVPIFKVRTFRDHAESSLDVWAMRLGSLLLGVFSAFAMFVAVVGIYSVKAYQVSRRTREIGIRMALGALPAAVQSLILREGLATAAIGLGFGLLLGLGLNRALASVLHGVRGFDPVVLGACTTLFFLAAAIACWIPARRATKVNPLEALRAE